MYSLIGGRYCVGVPDDIAKRIWEASFERLTDEISPIDRLMIDAAKKAIESNKVLPFSELTKKRREYNNLYNEGVEGYNPYDSYMTAEQVAHVKKSFPNLF